MGRDVESEIALQGGVVSEWSGAGSVWLACGSVLSVAHAPQVERSLTGTVVDAGDGVTHIIPVITLLWSCFPFGLQLGLIVVRQTRQ